MNKKPSTIHSRIVECREKLKLTQAQLAKAVGVSTQSVQQWEKGTSAPKRDRLMLVAQKLGTTVENLTFGATDSVKVDPLAKQLLWFWDNLSPERRNDLLIEAQKLFGEENSPAITEGKRIYRPIPKSKH